MKWKASSAFPVGLSVSSIMKGSFLANELWVILIYSLLPIVWPLSLNGRERENAFKFVNSYPISISLFLFNNIDKIAWVAHALLITWLAKKS